MTRDHTKLVRTSLPVVNRLSSVVSGVVLRISLYVCVIIIILLRRVRLVERIHFDEVLQSSQFSK